MASNKRHDRLKKFKIIYFVGDYYSSEGEEERSTTLLAHSEEEAENDFRSIFRDAHFGWIEEI